MANKEKLLANAQKFLSKGQLSKAISEYQTLIGAFPKDVRNRQKLAELLSRDKRNEEALTEYEAVAKHYTETGFYLKAIAVFKQMQKLEPSRVTIYHRLAELNEKQGLIGNALTEYRNLVAFYEQNSMRREAIEVLGKMLVLDPDNLNISIKIAECCMASGRKDEAFERFQGIIAPLAVRGEHAKVIKLYERFLTVCPEDSAARLPLAKALLASGSSDKATQVLKSLLKSAPEDPGIHRCLTDAYVAAGDFVNARLTLQHLFKHCEADLDLREYYVRICIDAGEMEHSRDRLEEWKEAFFRAGRLTVLRGYYEALAEALAGDPQVAESLAAIDQAIGATAGLGRQGVAPPTDPEPAATAEKTILELAFDDVEAFDMIGEEVPADVEVSALATLPPGKDLPAEKIAAVGIELDLDIDFDVSAGQATAASAAAIPPLEATRADKAEREIEVEVEIDLGGMGDFDLEFEAEPVVEEEPVAEAAPDAPAGDELDLEIDLELPLDTEFAAAFAEEPELSFDDDSAQMDAAHEQPETLLENEELARIEEPDNLLEDGVLADSEDLDELEELHELEDLDDIDEFEELEVLQDLEEVAVSPAGVTPAQGDFAAALSVDAELEEAQFYLQQGLYDNAERVVRTLQKSRPDLPELQTRLVEISQGRQAAEAESADTAFVDLMADLQDDDLLAATDFLDAFGGAVHGDDELSQRLVSEIDSADTESHYNLGIAYKEMGLYDDAIAEFDKARKDPARTIDCLTLTGQCHKEAGDVAAALAVFRSGLARNGISDEARMTLNFELGMLHQGNGELLDALEYFQLVAERDSFFRDVGELIKNLRRELGLDNIDDDGGPQGNRDRVSYV